MDIEEIDDWKVHKNKDTKFNLFDSCDEGKVYLL